MPDTPSFDLRTEPWIPATFISDGQEHMVSLTDALLNARDIRSIGGDMPIQTPAITRLLLSVLYGLCPGGPPLDEWRELWDEGPFGDDITDYLDQYADRWDLFDERTPFFQVADLRTEKGTYSGLEKLIFDVPNGDPFFTTRLGEGLQRISFAEAARWLVTAQAFDPSGIKSGAVGDPRVKGGKGYPIGIAWTGNLGVLICEGANLWQTLLLNFVGSELNPHGEPLPWSDDMPAWERPHPTALATPGLDQEHPGDVRRFHGPATLMTWQSRRIRLIHDDQWVTGVIIANGDQLKPQMADSHETMTAWRESEPQEKALGQPLVYMPRTHTPNRAIWRGIATFLPSGAISGEQPAKSKPPLTVDWLNKLELRGLLPDIQVRMHAYGVTYGSNNSVIDEVVDDAMDLHLHVLASDSDDVKQCFVSAAGMADKGPTSADPWPPISRWPPRFRRTRGGPRPPSRPTPRSTGCTGIGPRASPHRTRSTRPANNGGALSAAHSTTWATPCSRRRRRARSPADMTPPAPCNRRARPICSSVPQSTN